MPLSSRLPLIVFAGVTLSLSPELATANSCGPSYAVLAEKVESGKLTPDTMIFTYNADGSPRMLELSLQDSRGKTMANIEAELRGGGEAYVIHYQRDAKLKNQRVGTWLMKQLVDQYGVTKFTAVLSETNIEQMEKAMAGGKTPEQAFAKTAFHNSCVELGFTKLSVKMMGNSADVSCGR